MTLQLGISDFEALTLTLVDLARRDMPRDLVVPWRRSWTGSPKPLSPPWAEIVGMFGGTATDKSIAHRLGQPVASVRSARNARLLDAARLDCVVGERFDLALKIYADSLILPPESVARQHCVLRQEATLYARRLGRALADLGFATLEAAIRSARNELRTVFYEKYDLKPEKLKLKWTESPSAMWALPQPAWWIH